MRPFLCVALAGASLVFPVFAAAQAVATAASSQASPTVPHVIRVTGVFAPANGRAASPVETVTFAIYADEKGGAPLWQETQYVTVGAGGQYAALLGATLPEGVPLDIFATGDARWLGRRFERVAGFAPRQGFEDLSWLTAQNLQDHAAATDDGQQT